MRVRYVEGVAIHSGPESCAVTREGVSEALTGVRTGQVLSRERSIIPGADMVTAMLSLVEPTGADCRKVPQNSREKPSFISEHLRCSESFLIYLTLGSPAPTAAVTVLLPARLLTNFPPTERIRSAIANTPIARRLYKSPIVRSRLRNRLE